MHTAPPRNYDSGMTKLYEQGVDISNSSKNQHCDRNTGKIRRYQTDCEERIRNHKIITAIHSHTNYLYFFVCF